MKTSAFGASLVNLIYALNCPADFDLRFDLSRSFYNLGVGYSIVRPTRTPEYVLP